MNFWDLTAGVYDLFADHYNRKVNLQLCETIKEMIGPEDQVLECACGTGMISAAIAPVCGTLLAGDDSEAMLRQARKKCRMYRNVEFVRSDITKLDLPDHMYDKVIAANVLHLLEDPYKALHEMERVCRHGGTLIIPTYVNKEKTGKTDGFVSAVGKAGADFKKQFTFRTYQEFFREAGYEDGKYTLISGRIPCAVAVLKNR